MTDRSRGEDPVPDAEIDRQFAELVELYYSSGRDIDGPTGDRAAVDEPTAAGPSAAGDEPEQLGLLGPAQREDWHTAHPLFQPPPEPDEPPDPIERYVPGAMEPMPRLSRPALAGALMLTTSILIGLLAVLGLPFSPWAGWLAITGFTIGMVLLLSRLPRNRDPEDGDGAVL